MSDSVCSLSQANTDMPKAQSVTLTNWWLALPDGKGSCPPQPFTSVIQLWQGISLMVAPAKQHWKVPVLPGCDSPEQRCPVYLEFQSQELQTQRHCATEGCTHLSASWDICMVQGWHPQCVKVTTEPRSGNWTSHRNGTHSKRIPFEIWTAVL